MWQRFYCQRRRFLFGWIALSGLLWASAAQRSTQNGMDPYDPITIVAMASAVFLLFTPAFLILIFVLARWRAVLEILILAILADLALSKAMPLPADMEVMGFVQFMSLVILMERLLYSAMLTGNIMSLPRPFRRTFKTSAPRQEVWAALAPLPEFASRHWYPGTDVTKDPEDASAFVLSYPVRWMKEPMTERFVIQTADAPRALRARFHLQHPGDTVAHTGTTEVTLTPLEGGGTQVTYIEILDAAPFRRRLQWWMDDEFRDRMNALRAHLDGRRDWSMMARQFPKDAKTRKQNARMAEVFS
ncbi:MAG: SRPBCC domain-containing protein [Pseudomonadota bacterium]